MATHKFEAPVCALAKISFDRPECITGAFPPRPGTMPPEGKSDMERVGIFQEMGYISIGDKYTPFVYRESGD